MSKESFGLVAAHEDYRIEPKDLWAATRRINQSESLVCNPDSCQTDSPSYI
jgi:hypothetical protein